MLSKVGVAVNVAHVAAPQVGVVIVRIMSRPCRHLWWHGQWAWCHRHGTILAEVVIVVSGGPFQVVVARIISPSTPLRTSRWLSFSTVVTCVASCCHHLWWWHNQARGSVCTRVGRPDGTDKQHESGRDTRQHKGWVGHGVTELLRWGAGQTGWEAH